MENRWRSSRPAGACEVDFFIDYEFKSRILGLLMGAMFDRAFRRFAEAFENRADDLRAGADGLASGQLGQHGERLRHRAPPHLAAADVAEAFFAVDEPAAARRGGEMHEADRLVGAAAAGAGDAGDRHREIGRAWPSAPRAIASAVSRLTAPWRSSIAAERRASRAWPRSNR